MPHGIHKNLHKFNSNAPNFFRSLQNHRLSDNEFFLNLFFMLLHFSTIKSWYLAVVHWNWPQNHPFQHRTVIWSLQTHLNHQKQIISQFPLADSTKWSNFRILDIFASLLHLEIKYELMGITLINSSPSCSKHYFSATWIKFPEISEISTVLD